MHKFLMAVILVVLAPAQCQSQTKSAGNPSPAQPSQQTSRPPSGVSQPEVSDHSQDRPSNDEPKRSGSFLDYLGVGLTVVIAIAATVQAGCAFWQANIYKRQYDVMSKALIASNQSAEAALKSLTALEKLERPFLMVDLRGQEGFKDEIWLVNKGKVPAQILWYNPMGTFRLQSSEQMDEMPAAEKFNYGYLHDVETAKVINVPWIAPDGEMKLTNFDWISLADDLKAAFQNGQKFAYLLSTVKYRGMLTNTVFESRWCCRWFGRNYGGLRLDGPPGYDGFT